MKIVNGKIELETEKCVWCSSNNLDKGKAPGKKPCGTCKGTRRGKRGGLNGCKDCYSGTECDWDNPIECNGCEGAGEQQETLTSYLPVEAFKTLTFKVYIADRGISFNESYIGVGTVWSCGDYGRAWEVVSGEDDEEVIQKFIHNVLDDASGVQACKITASMQDPTVCNHVAIIVNRGGYSLRAAFTDDASDVLKQVNGEPSVSLGKLIGMKVYNDGGNGTLAAAGVS